MSRSVTPIATAPAGSERSSAPSPFARIMRAMGKRFWPYSIGLVIHAATIAVCFNVILAFLMKDVIDAAAQNNGALIRRAVTLALVTFLGGTPLLVGTRYLVAVCIQRTLTDLRTRLFNHITHLPMAHLTEGHSGDLISRATNDLQAIEAVYFDQLNFVLIAITMGVVSIVSIFTLDWRVGLVAVVLGLLTTVATVGFAKPTQQAGALIQARSGTLTERLIDLLQGMSVTRLFGLAPRIHRRFSEANADLTDAHRSMGRVQSYSELVNTGLQWLKNVGFLGLGLVLYDRGELALGSVWAIVALQANAGLLFSSLGSFVTGIQQSLVAASRVFEVLDQPTEPITLGDPSEVALHRPDISAAGIAMRDVAFSYGQDEGQGASSPAPTALHDLSLTVDAGQVAAIVGPSGAGKSTITRLLLGLYGAATGEITIGGRPLTTIPLAELREMMAYVPQEAHLFDGTIEDNLRLGRPSARPEEVVAAAKAAGAHDFIIAQPKGYLTEIGEDGTKLSGGQRQRIAIARALLKDAPILLLDEATSALDSESETVVQEALDRLMEGRTTLAIAHRLSTIEHADVIYVMQDGTVVEAGTHTNLLAQEGLYAKLQALQFA